MGLILADITQVGLLRLQIMADCPYLSFGPFFLPFCSSNINYVRRCTSSFRSRNLDRGNPSFASLILIWGGGEITFHESILIPIVNVIILLETYCSQFVLV